MVDLDPAFGEPDFSDRDRDIDVLVAGSFQPQPQPKWKTDEPAADESKPSGGFSFNQTTETDGGDQ